MPINIIEKGYREAEKIGQDCLHLLGTKASALASGYPQIWARDSIISSFGFSLIENEKFQQSFKKSLETGDDDCFKRLSPQNWNTFPASVV